MNAATKRSRRETKKQSANYAEYDHFEHALTTSASSSSSWVIDSGATSHITGTRNHFSSFDSNYRTSITLPNGLTMNATGRGDIRMQFMNGSNEIHNVRISDVLYIPGVNCNLLSVKQMNDKGIQVHFNNKPGRIRLG